MDSKRYDRSGKYAATHDFEFYSRDFFLSNVVDGFKAMTAGIELDVHTKCSCHKWSLDYLETGLKLLGYVKASSLVKTNFTESASVFAECLKKQAAGVKK